MSRRLWAALWIASAYLALTASAIATAAEPRVRDLDPKHLAEHTATISMSCVMLVDGTFNELGQCATGNPDGSYTIAMNARKQLKFDRHGLSSIVIRGEGYAYVRHDGFAMTVATFDNAPDEFIDGLVRVRIGDKFGFANHRLKLVIPADFDGAYRFSERRAWACIGCVSVSDGEHSWYRGGETVCLDLRGSSRPQSECEQAGALPSQLRE